MFTASVFHKTTIVLSQTLGYFRTMIIFLLISNNFFLISNLRLFNRKNIQHPQLFIFWFILILIYYNCIIYPLPFLTSYPSRNPTYSVSSPCLLFSLIVIANIYVYTYLFLNISCSVHMMLLICIFFRADHLGLNNQFVCLPWGRLLLLFSVLVSCLQFFKFTNIQFMTIWRARITLTSKFLQPPTSKTIFTGFWLCYRNTWLLSLCLSLLKLL